MTKRSIQNSDMPQALGPYSQVVAASGELIFISGQAGIDPSTGEAPPSFDRQARLAFENLMKVVRAAGLNAADVAKTTIYIADPSQFGVLNQLFGEFFPDAPPTRAVPVVQLPKGLLISIEAIAVRP